MGAAWPQWSEWAWVHASSFTPSSSRPTWSSARSSCTIEPGPCVPVSTITIPPSAPIAQALPCGTPGHGSGRRSRHRPGRTRSPRPKSRRWLIEGHDNLRASMASTTEVARRYFEALAVRDLDAAVECWAPGGVDRFVGQQELIAPEGVRQHFTELFAAFPDFEFEVVDTTTYRNRSAVRWRARATFAGPGRFQGLVANGARLEIEGCD